MLLITNILGLHLEGGNGLVGSFIGAGAGAGAGAGTGTGSGPGAGTKPGAGINILGFRNSEGL